MSGQLRFLLGYEQLVKNLLQSLSEDDAAAQAVGGNFEFYGVLEHALLRGEGLRDGSAVVDVGCGSGRLATKLARYPGLRYLGLDVVPELLDPTWTVVLEKAFWPSSLRGRVVRGAKPVAVRRAGSDLGPGRAGME